MMNKIVATTAILATTALAQSAGSAIVINQCSYPIWVTNVPASGGGQTQIGPNSLSTGQSYTQTYTQLTNGDGWSIKLSMDSALTSVMQYEYTYHNDGIIWFDMSEINGDPWDHNWLFTADGDCTPKQTAYQYSTDDAYGMQSCPDTSSITVTLCSGGNSTGSGGSWGSSPAAGSSPTAWSSPTAGWSAAPSSPTSTPPATTSPVPSTTASPPVASVAASGGAFGFGEKVASPSSPASSYPPQSSTLATVVLQNAAHTVTNMRTVVVTEYVMASPVPAASAPVKRHEHLHRHMAHHEHN